MEQNSKYWTMFSKYHYLSHSHNNAASVYIGTINDNIFGFVVFWHFRINFKKPL